MNQPAEPLAGSELERLRRVLSDPVRKDEIMVIDRETIRVRGAHFPLDAFMATLRFWADAPIRPETEVERLARRLCDEDAAYDDGTRMMARFPDSDYHPNWERSNSERRRYWLERAERQIERTPPDVGVTYQPGPDIVAQSLGLPRTVTRVETRPGLDVFVVHFRTDEGEGFVSNNLWAKWRMETGAQPVPNRCGSLDHHAG